MKAFFFTFAALFLFFCGVVSAQDCWEAQYSGQNTSTLFMRFTAVSDDVCWAVGRFTNQYIRTTNGGAQWTASSIPGVPLSWKFAYVAAIDANTAWIAMYDSSNVSGGGVFKTTNGGATWSPQNIGFTTGSFPKIIYFFDANDGICVGNPKDGYWEVYTTSNGGTNWTRVPQSNFPPLSANEIQTFHFYSSASNSFWFMFSDAIIEFGGFFRTTDRGQTWERKFINNGVPALPVFKDPNNGLMGRFVPNPQLFKTTDGGDSFTQILPYNLGFVGGFIAYAPGTPGGYMITSGNYPGFPTTPGSAYTLDNGITWNLCDNTVTRGISDFASATTGWCGSDNDSVYKYVGSPLPVELASFNSTISGNSIQLTWQTATETNNQGFEIYRNGSKIAFVEGKGTTTETQDYSFVDKNLQSGIYNYRLNQLDFDGTQEVVGELTVYLTLPEQFSLEQNYPNPFNPSTTIKYSIPTSEFVSLKVYDVLGNEVATLVNEQKPAGSYEIDFNATDLSSGIYLYTLQAGSYTQTKKLILMK